jgi:Fic family protein
MAPAEMSLLQNSTLPLFFFDGNGRMARLLMLLLLYKAGYEVGRYISLEQMVEQTKEGYYDTLYTSSQGWHEMQHAILP